MAFANPIWLWALAGLLVPAAIHLLSRKEGNVIRLGSVRHVEDSASTRFSSIRLNEILLLLVRCLLLIWVVSLLSGLHFLSNTSVAKKWLVIEKGLENDKDFALLIDSLKKEDFEPRYLADGFPEVDDAELNDQTSYWSLVEDLKSNALHQAVVLSYNYVERFKGKRTNLPENIRWISKTPPLHEFQLAAIRLTADSTWVRYGMSDGMQTKFTTLSTKQDGTSSLTADSINMVLVCDEAYEYDKRIMLAALQTLKQNTPFHFNIRTFTSDQWKSGPGINWIIWFSENEHLSGKASLITISKEGQSGSSQFISPVGPSHWRINSRLNEGVALDQNFTIQLARLILPDKELLALASLNDRRILPDNLAWSDFPAEEIAMKASGTAGDASLYWMALALLTLIGERLLAAKRKQ